MTFGQLFGVTIDRSQYCWQLRDAMKANNPTSLTTIDSRQLQLWKVNFLIGEDDVVPEMEEPYLKLSVGK